MIRLAYPDPPLRDDVVLLRPWAEADLGCVEEASRDAEIPQGTTVPGSYTEAEGLAFIRRQWSRERDGRGLSLAVADPATGRAVGAAVLTFREDPATVGLGYWVVRSARKRGYASHAAALLARWAVSRAGRARVEALVEPSNTASIRVVEGAGFRREGLLRSYLVLTTRRADVFMYSLLPGDVD